MHAVGIRRVYTGDGAPLGLYRVDPEAGQFKTEDAEMQFAGHWNITDIVNGKKETIAYTVLFNGKVFVAAGVDAVLAVALFAASEANEKTAVSTRVPSGATGTVAVAVAVACSLALLAVARAPPRLRSAHRQMTL